MTTATLTITDFILQRVAEDEQLALAEEKLMPSGSSGIVPAVAALDDSYPHTIGSTPARVLAECEAKRRLVDMSDAIDVEMRNLAGTPGESLVAGRRSACDLALRALAAVYADHPDYREEWRP